MRSKDSKDLNNIKLTNKSTISFKILSLEEIINYLEVKNIVIDKSKLCSSNITTNLITDLIADLLTNIKLIKREELIIKYNDSNKFFSHPNLYEKTSYYIKIYKNLKSILDRVFNYKDIYTSDIFNPNEEKTIIILSALIYLCRIYDKINPSIESSKSLMIEEINYLKHKEKELEDVLDEKAIIINKYNNEKSNLENNMKELEKIQDLLKNKNTNLEEKEKKLKKDKETFQNKKIKIEKTEADVNNLVYNINNLTTKIVESPNEVNDTIKLQQTSLNYLSQIIDKENLLNSNLDKNTIKLIEDLFNSIKEDLFNCSYKSYIKLKNDENNVLIKENNLSNNILLNLKDQINKLREKNKHLKNMNNEIINEKNSKLFIYNKRKANIDNSNSKLEEEINYLKSNNKNLLDNFEKTKAKLDLKKNDLNNIVKFSNDTLLEIEKNIDTVANYINTYCLEMNQLYFK